MKKVLIYLLLIGNYVGLIAFWWHFSGQLFLGDNLGGTFIAVGRLTGLLATNLILNQLILIGRVKWVESVFGLDKLSRVHKWCGYTILGLAILHPILITQGHAILNETSYFGQYFDFLRSWDELLKAFLGWVILFITAVISITIVRRKLKYESWYYVHIFNYAAIALIFGHQLKFGSDSNSEWFRFYWYFLYIFAFSNLIWFRFIRPLINFWRFSFTVTTVEDLGPATSVFIGGKNLANFKRQAGQFMISRFLQKGFWYEAHPFSLSWGPNNDQLRLTAKKLGDFTNKLPALKAGTKVIIDGPHGVFTSQKIKRDKVLLIAGGIGITPLRSLTEELAGATDLTLIYSARTKADAVLLDELKAIKAKRPFNLVEIYAEEKVPQHFGRLDKAILSQQVPDLAEREVFLCGPPPMMDALKTILRELNLPDSQLHWERFAL